MNNVMHFPETFEEFAKEYGFKDDKEIYTNGSDLIPIFRVKQWIEHDNKGKMADNNLCDSCSTHGCEFQSGIIRTSCAFYMPLPPPMTNGDMIKVMFPNEEFIDADGACVYYGAKMRFDKDWWNAPYKKGAKE